MFSPLSQANMAFGQGVGASGTIYGTISDSTGAVLPNVKVTVTNTGTNAAFNTESNSAGDFNAPSLQPGTYRVSAEAPGFQKAVTDAFTLAVDQKIRINLVFEAGSGNGNAGSGCAGREPEHRRRRPVPGNKRGRGG